MRPADDIEKLVKKLRYKPSVQAHNRGLANVIQALENRQKPAGLQPNIWRIIMKSPITKLAAAAVIMIGVFIGINHFGGSVDGARVAWADVIKNIDPIRTSTYRTKTSLAGLSYVKGGSIQETEGFAYYSADHGMRRDKYENGKIMRIEYWIPAERAVVAINPQMKTYSRTIFSEEEFRNKYKKREWKEFIKHFMSFDYVELGYETINGVDVEGIEVADPKVMLESLFESVVVRLWVGVETNLPVRIEMEGTAASGAVKCEQVVDVVELDGEVEAIEFEPNIPGDYTLIAEAEIDDKNEGMAVQGLRIFAEITGGRYPSSMAVLTAVNELWKARSDKKVSKEEVEKGITVQSTCSFYAALDRANKDVAYYGDTITAENVDAVLMRWKISDDEYRVIFGDLTTENVTAARLAELEKPSRK